MPILAGPELVDEVVTGWWPVVRPLDRKGSSAYTISDTMATTITVNSEPITRARVDRNSPARPGWRNVARFEARPGSSAARCRSISASMRCSSMDSAIALPPRCTPVWNLALFSPGTRSLSNCSGFAVELFPSIRSGPHEGIEQVVEFSGRVSGEAGVDRSRLDDRAARGGQPAKPLPQRPPGQRPLGAGPAERGQSGPHRVQVGPGVQDPQPAGVQLDPGAQVAVLLGVHDDPGVDGLAAFDPGHHPDQRVLEDFGAGQHGSRRCHRWISSGSSGTRASRYSA